MSYSILLIVYDVAKRESFTNLGDVWTKEIDSNSSNKDCIKMLVGNKVDKVPFFFQTEIVIFPEYFVPNLLFLSKPILPFLHNFISIQEITHGSSRHRFSS